jgi:pyrroloquinoline-quinone synthase
MNLIERIDEARTRWNVLDHPFYLRWERGELGRDELAFYAGEYRHAVVALADAAAIGGDPEHAAEEAAHIELWDDFAAALKAPLDREPSIETRECAAAWRPEDSLAARAVLYAVESGQPDIARTKLTITGSPPARRAPSTSNFTRSATTSTPQRLPTFSAGQRPKTRTAS